MLLRRPTSAAQVVRLSFGGGKGARHDLATLAFRNVARNGTLVQQSESFSISIGSAWPRTVLVRITEISRFLPISHRQQLTMLARFSFTRRVALRVSTTSVEFFAIDS